MKFTRYDSYKDSEVEWLGEIPRNWNLTHLKRGSLLVQDGTHGSFQRIDEGFPLLSVRNIIETKFVRLNDDSFISEKDYKIITKTFRVKPGDIQLAIVGATLGKVAVVDLTEPFATQRSLATIRINKKSFNIKYVFYYLQSIKAKDYLWMNTNFSAQPGVYLLTINSIVIPKFDINLQKNISYFLNKKTSQIDRKINLLQGKKGSYKELKKSLINETVCRGLNKDVELKDSGIKGIGNIPKHWNVERCKSFVYLKGRIGWKALKNDEYVDKGYALLTSYNLIKDEKYVNFYNKTNYIPKWRYDESPEIKIKKDDILMSKIEGRVGYVKELEQESSINSSLMLIRINDEKLLKSKFLFYVFISNAYVYFFNINQNGSAMQSISQENVKQFKFAYPFKQEQIQIVNYLDEKTSKIDKIILKINDQIETLKEFRKTLINDVVTGKVRIQNE